MCTGAGLECIGAWVVLGSPKGRRGRATVSCVHVRRCIPPRAHALAGRWHVLLSARGRCTARAVTPPMSQAAPPQSCSSDCLRYYATVALHIHPHHHPTLLPVVSPSRFRLGDATSPTIAHRNLLTTTISSPMHVPLLAASPSPNRAVSGGEALSGRDGGGGGRSSASRSPGGTGPGGEGAAGGRGAAYDSPAVGGGLISA